MGEKKRSLTTLATKEIKPCEAIMSKILCLGGKYCFALKEASKDYEGLTLSKMILEGNDILKGRGIFRIP